MASQSELARVANEAYVKNSKQKITIIYQFLDGRTNLDEFWINMSVERLWTSCGELTSVFTHDGGFDVVRCAGPHADWLWIITVDGTSPLVKAVVPANTDAELHYDVSLLEQKKTVEDVTKTTWNNGTKTKKNP